MDEKAIREIESRIGYTFRKKEILVTAFTHASYANIAGVKSYDRLEFLGDALLGLIAAQILFRADRTADEGSLSTMRVRLVRKESFCAASEKLGFPEFLQKERNMTLSAKIVSDLYESVAAAMYLDSHDLDVCEQFFIRTVLNGDLSSAAPVDYISRLKEWREKNKQADFAYSATALADANGGFSFSARVLGVEFVGTGRKKKDAERDACRKICDFLKI